MKEKIKLNDKIRVRFKVRKRGKEIKSVSSFQFVGFVRGLVKAGMDITVLNTIETESTDDFYIIDILMKEKHFNFAKGQAGSYGVIVERDD